MGEWWQRVKLRWYAKELDARSRCFICPADHVEDEPTCADPACVAEYADMERRFMTP